jgi:hypothetical protein
MPKERQQPEKPNHLNSDMNFIGTAEGSWGA